MQKPPDKVDTRPSGIRVQELDGIRGIAILLVLVWHYLQNQLHAEAGSPLAYFKQSIAFTWSGVDLFFVLSGFLIAGILMDKRGTSHYFRTFYIRRVCRIFPLYFLNLGLFVSFLALSPDLPQVLFSLAGSDEVPLWSYFTFTQNILMASHNSAGPGWLAVTWSLAVEEQFYLFFPLLVWLTPVRRLPYLFLWFIAMAVYMRLAIPGLSAYINTLWRADSLMTGALLAYLVRVPGFTDTAGKYRHFIALVFLLSASAMLFANQHGYIHLGGAFTHLSLSLIYGLLIMLALLYRGSLAGRFLCNRLLVWLGTISYGVYIIHTWISRLVHAVIRDAAPSIASWSDAATTLLALAITLLLAHTSFHAFEKRFTSFGHRISYGH